MTTREENVSMNVTLQTLTSPLQKFSAIIPLDAHTAARLTVWTAKNYVITVMEILFPSACNAQMTLWEIPSILSRISV